MVDTINLFDINETKFESNGIGSLPDASKCEITEERNGEYELTMEYPVTGKNFSEIILKRIILAKPNPYDRKQPFRIYYISKPIKGTVTIKAEHVRYDLSGFPVITCNALSASSALSALVSNSPVKCPFTTWSDRTQNGTFTVDKPTSILSVLGGNEGSVLDIFGGEYEWDRFEVKLHNNRGKDRGVKIRYGKNLTDLTQEENCSNVYTGVLPYWQGTVANSDETLRITLPEYIVNVPGSFSFVRIYILDLSSEFQEAPSAEQLRESTDAYILEHKIGVPEVSLKVSFVKLSQSEEYSNYKLLETVKLCDTVTVEFPELGVNATSKVISTTYDALTDKYKQIELGEASTKNLAATIATTTKTLKEDVPSVSLVQQISEETAKLFNGCYGGFIMYNYLDGQEQPYEMLVMDTDDIKTAKNVWRFNNTGIAFSNNGYDGPWIVGMNMHGNINGQMIGAGTINGNAIQSGSINISDLSGAEEVVTKADMTYLSEYFEEGELWFDFDKNRNSGLWIGRKDSRFAINITNTRMAFVELPEDIELTTITSNMTLGYGYFIDDDKTIFLKKVNSKTGEYLFLYNDAGQWTLNGEVVSLYSYGLGVSGSPVEGWSIKVTVQGFSDYENGNIKAYVAYNKLFIPTAHSQERLAFGKNYNADIFTSTSGLNASFINGDIGMKRFISAVYTQKGEYTFEYLRNEWNDIYNDTWDNVALKTWEDLGVDDWYLNKKSVQLSTYGLRIERVPVNNDIIIINFDGEPIEDFAFIVKESGNLQFKWVGAERPDLETE